MDSNQILHTSKDHQICFVGGPETQETNPRWQTTAILKNRKIMISLQLLDLGSFSFTWEKPLGLTVTGFLQAGSLCCHPTITAKEPKET